MISPRLTRLALACLALLCIAAISAGGTTIYTTSPSDGMVGYQSSHDGFPAMRYAYLAEPTAGAYYNDSGYITNEYATFQFPISDLRGVTLAPGSVTLNVYCTYDNTENTDVVRLCGENYDGGGMLSSDLYLGGKSLVADVAIPGAGNWLQADITSDLQRQINNGYDWATYYFQMNFVIPTSYYGNKVAFSTYEDTAHKPYLDITPVPEPSSLMALACGVMGLGGVFVRRRKK